MSRVRFSGINEQHGDGEAKDFNDVLGSLELRAQDLPFQVCIPGPSEIVLPGYLHPQ